jgi:hypothetical protein
MGIATTIYYQKHHQSKVYQQEMDGSFMIPRSSQQHSPV